jgi:uncharacterized membrane protein
MNGTEAGFNRGAVRPMQCLREGWGLIKEHYWLWLGITLVGVLIASAAPLYLLLGPMMCGIHVCLLDRWHGQRPSFNRLFEGFNYFGQGLVATLLMVVPMLLLMTPCIILYMIYVFQLTANQPKNKPPTADFLWEFLAATGVYALAITLVSVVVGVFFFFVYPLLVDRRLSGVEAVKLSARAALANFGGVLGLLILNSLLSILGLLACYVGAFFVMPLYFASTLVAYRQVFPAQPRPDAYLPEDAPRLPGEPERPAPPSTDIQGPLPGERFREG